MSKALFSLEPDTAFRMLQFLRGDAIAPSGALEATRLLAKFLREEEGQCVTVQEIREHMQENFGWHFNGGRGKK